MSNLSKKILSPGYVDGGNYCAQEILDLAAEVEVLERVLRTLGKASDDTGALQAVTGSDLSVASVAQDKPNDGGSEDSETILLQTPVRRALCLATLRPVNVLRSRDDFNHSLDSWSVAEWSNAMAGEAGEACNIAKKMLRFRDGVRGNIQAESISALREKLSGEIADVVIYADLLAASQEINLSEAIILTFNRKSEQIGSEYFL